MSWKFRDQLPSIVGARRLHCAGCALADFAPVAIDCGSGRLLLFFGFVLAVGFYFEAGGSDEVGGEFSGRNIERELAGRRSLFGQWIVGCSLLDCPAGRERNRERERQRREE